MHLKAFEAFILANRHDNIYCLDICPFINKINVPIFVTEGFGLGSRFADNTFVHDYSSTLLGELIIPFFSLEKSKLLLLKRPVSIVFVASNKL